MPITSSAKKALRASAKKRVWNIRRKSSCEVVEKKLKKLITEKKVSEAKAFLPQVQKAFDKAAKMGTIKKGTADRKKSRLSAFVKKNS